MTGNLAIARREPLGNNRLLDSSPASAVALSAPSCGPSQISPAMPANGSGQRVRLVPTRRASGDATATAHPDTERYETMFVSNLDVIEGVIRYVCQRQKLAGSEAEDFGSEVKVRLVDRDYEVLRKFQERSTLRTYLTIVIQRIYLDYRNHLWGKWRPSAEAQRLGPVAVRLETLMARDGFSFDQAGEYLRTNEHIVARDSELNAIAVRLPIRVRRAMVGDEELETVADTTSRVDDRLLYKERHAGARRILDALTDAMRSLSDQDRVILRLRFQDGLALADIARALHLDQKPLYRRFDALLRHLRATLEAAGINPVEACELVNRKDVDISLALLAGASGANDANTSQDGAQGRSS